ncbi:hypothetical protein MMPV_002051 [Pyropia vietnamensis]
MIATSAPPALTPARDGGETGGAPPTSSTLPPSTSAPPLARCAAYLPGKARHCRFQVATSSGGKRGGGGGDSGIYCAYHLHLDPLSGGAARGNARGGGGSPGRGGDGGVGKDDGYGGGSGGGGGIGGRGVGPLRPAGGTRCGGCGSYARNATRHARVCPVATRLRTVAAAPWYVRGVNRGGLGPPLSPTATAAAADTPAGGGANGPPMDGGVNIDGGGDGGRPLPASDRLAAALPADPAARSALFAAVDAAFATLSADELPVAAAWVAAGGSPPSLPPPPPREREGNAGHIRHEPRMEAQAFALVATAVAAGLLPVAPSVVAGPPKLIPASPATVAGAAPAAPTAPDAGTCCTGSAAAAIAAAAATAGAGTSAVGNPATPCLSPRLLSPPPPLSPILVEFGAGRGYLTLAALRALPSPPPGRPHQAVLLDYASPRFKADRGVPGGVATLHRLRIDLGDVHLGRTPPLAAADASAPVANASFPVAVTAPAADAAAADTAAVAPCTHTNSSAPLPPQTATAAPSCRPVVSLGKHVCGEAADMAVVAALRESPRGGGLVMACCCRHRCAWATFTGRAAVSSWGLGPTDGSGGGGGGRGGDSGEGDCDGRGCRWDALCAMSSWALSGGKKGYGADAAASGDGDGGGSLPRSRRMELGERSRALLDAARLRGVRAALAATAGGGGSARLVTYVRGGVSPENVALVVTFGGGEAEGGGGAPR